jgi:adenylate cyclase
MIQPQDNQPFVLLVDDAVENLQVLTALLKDIYRIRVAKSGEKALEMLKSGLLPDLILLDIIMPGMDGYEVCKQLKADTSTMHIPVIFLTALNDVNDETKGFRAGGADFITKPFNPDIVLARINTHISLQAERRKSESLLQILLPKNVIAALMRDGKYSPEIHPEVSILFSDFVDFTKIATQVGHEDLIDELSSIFGAFDEICLKNNITRIKTIGDAYMAVSGIEEQTSNHASQLVKTGLEFIEFLKERNKTSKIEWNCRIGIHSGSVIGGIVGKSRFVYDVMGDTVNIASRIETNGQPMMVAISSETRKLIGHSYQVASLGIANLKGRGEKEIFTVVANGSNK